MSAEDMSDFWRPSYVPKISKRAASMENKGWATFEDFTKGMEVVDLSNPQNEHAGLPVYSKDVHSMYLDISDMHNLIISSSGTGKSRRIITQYILSFLNTKESAFVIDVKGELSKMTAGKLQAAGKNVKIINLRDPRNSWGWNMFAAPLNKYLNGNLQEKDEAISDIMDITNVICPTIPDQKEPFWNTSAQGAIGGASLVNLKKAKKVDDFTIWTVATLINKHFSDEVSAHKFNSKLDSASLESMLLSPTCDNADTTRRCIIGEARSKLIPFIQSEALTDMLSRDDIHFDDMIDNTVTFMIIPDEKSNMGPLVTIFIKQFYQYLISRAYFNGGSLDDKFHFLIDEAGNIGPIPDLPSMLAAGRSRGIRITHVYQSISQINNMYGPNADTVLSNSPNLVYIFCRDRVTLETISFLLDRKKDGSPLMSIAELQQLDARTGEAIIMRGRKLPFMTHLSDISKFELVLDLPVPKCAMTRTSNPPAAKAKASSAKSKSSASKSKTVVAKLEAPVLELDEDDFISNSPTEDDVDPDDFEIDEFYNMSTIRSNLSISAAFDTMGFKFKTVADRTNLVKRVKNTMAKMHMLTNNVDDIIDFLDVVRIYHDDLLIQKLRDRGYIIDVVDEDTLSYDMDSIRDEMRLLLS